MEAQKQVVSGQSVKSNSISIVREQPKMLLPMLSLMFFTPISRKPIDYLRIPHNTLCLPPKFYITYCLKMLLGKCNTPRSI